MRLATRVLRDVQLKRPLPGRRASHLRPRLQPSCNARVCSSSTAHCYGIRRLSTASLPAAVADYDLIHPELLLPSRASTETAAASPQPDTRSSLVIESRDFNRWAALLSDPARLAVESDFFREGPAKQWASRLLVDKFENHGDLALWGSLLDFQMRINGPAGVAHVWRGLWGRKSLHDVSSPLAEMFWRVMLEGALMSDDPSFLENIWVYSEWMYDLHQVRWPHLYTTIIRHMLRTHQHEQTLKWHIRLMRNFYPGPHEFSSIIKEFALDKELYQLHTLPTLYKTSPVKGLYDVLLPYLFDHGESSSARTWRRHFIRHGEVPLIPAPVKPFLRFLKGYYPDDTLTPEEAAALKFTPESVQSEVPNLTREFVNRVYGRTFGITVKNYNDRLGAKWFASSWVSLDGAIAAVSALGIEKIGPLSLQSIALRTENSEDTLNRISQLREHGISVLDSNYYQLVLHLARKKDNELLYDLLRSDLHPDVFDDINLQTRLVNSAKGISDWRTMRLLLVARLVVFQRSAREIANNVLRVSFQQRNQDGVLNILEDMKSRNIPLNFEEAEHIYQNLIDDYNDSQRILTAEPSAFYLSIFRQLRTMDVPVPLSHWKLLILNMARQGRFRDLERLCVELVDMYRVAPSQRPGFVPLHIWDLPADMKGPLADVENLLGVYIPQDIWIGHSKHPLRELFDNKVLTAVVESAFVYSPGQGFSSKHSPQPARSQPHIAKVIRLLRLLRERGVWIASYKIDFIVTNCLVNIYGPRPPRTNSARSMRAVNVLPLQQMKTLVDISWGRPLLKPLDKLAMIVHTRRPGATLDTTKRKMEQIAREQQKEEDRRSFDESEGQKELKQQQDEEDKGFYDHFRDVR
ncbi:hypothetical protein F4808DRAFT_426182 [Astrocystis sublimbata]|nr:hypothetical protein F4808DRAFT_426182 [Astrocystis sublimbata]